MGDLLLLPGVISDGGVDVKGEGVLSRPVRPGEGVGKNPVHTVAIVGYGDAMATEC